MLIEREAELAVLAAAVEDALSRRGRLVFVGGEAGVGKTAVIGRAAELAADRIRVRRGVVDNVTTAAALGALVDAVPEMTAVLDAAREVSRLDLFRRLRAVLSAEPTLVVLEDVHWADDATLDLLRFLGRRLDELPLLLIATYRSEEVAADRRLALVMGELATAPGVSRLPVSPMSLAAVRELVALTGSALDPVRLHERTGGNAFYVTEVLATPGDDLPETVRDAALARAARLSPAAQDVLAAASVLGRPASADQLVDVSGRPAEGVDECVEHGLLVAELGGWAFRHELARLAVEQDLSPTRATALHARALTALMAVGSDDDRRLAHHAAGAGERGTAHHHAARAAARGARLGAHRAAVEQYRVALRFHGGDPTGRGRLLAALSYECYLTDDIAEALAARLQAMELAEVAGDAEALGRHQRWVSRLSWFLGRNADSERHADRAIATLEPGGDSHELAMAYSNKAQLCMLATDTGGAQEWGARALTVARRLGDREAEIHALNNVGTALLLVDEIEGRALVQRSLDLALVDDAQEHAARAYTNLGSAAVLNRQLATAERDLRAGIAYCVDRDLDAWTLYMGAFLSRALAEQGRYDEADERAAEVLRHPRLSPITTTVAASVRAQLAMRRGQDAHALLERGWAVAVGTGEVQRLAPAAAAQAEAAWLSGRPHDCDEALDIAWSAVAAHPVSWQVGEIAYWRAVAGRSAEPSVAVAGPFALMLEQRWLDAAAAWQVLGCPLWQALALARAPDIAAARGALEIVDGLGAPAVRHAIIRDRHAAGLPVPRGPRAAHRDNPAALTARELDVLHLLAEGLSNAEIAAQLFLSEKTVEHHVSAVLRKLGEPTRAHAAATAVREGLVAPPTRPSARQT
jgi:DNA-binding CsgD family transcriptional regulator/tetratricopeptide (TPR) repeat protein